MAVVVFSYSFGTSVLPYFLTNAFSSFCWHVVSFFPFSTIIMKGGRGPLIATSLYRQMQSSNKRTCSSPEVPLASREISRCGSANAFKNSSSFTPCSLRILKQCSVVILFSIVSTRTAKVHSGSDSNKVEKGRQDHFAFGKNIQHG